MTYCDYIKTLTGDQLVLHKEYHDNHYGFLIENDNELFERLMFEINQAGLNWIFIGYLPGAHSPECPVFERIKLLKQKK